MHPDSLLTGENAAFLDEQYLQWLADPKSVPAAFRDLFASWDVPQNGHGYHPGEVPTWPRRSIFNPPSTQTTTGSVVVDGSIAAKTVMLINAWRVRGHMESDLDPLDRREKVAHPELTLEHYGLGAEHLDVEVGTAPLFGMSPKATLREVVAHLRQTYASSIGAEFMNINEQSEKRWVQEQLETLPNRERLTREEERHILRKMADAENFEQLLHTRFPGTKRFSLEGAETLIPLLDLLIDHAAYRGVREVVLGMAHRGRLNVLANLLEKPVHVIADEFQDSRNETWQGSGDVKYHLGYSADVTTARGDKIHLSLAFNPSHLEAVDPVVEGRVRAKQDRDGDHQRVRGMAVLLHGDAAFAGQGMVAEVLNLSELHGYRTGGTIHIIVNNQIGFTTPPGEGRSTPYCTDIARMLGIPIFHVNGEDPHAVAAVVQIAVEWRQRFHRDVVIDMYCYRKHGHNEGDEPSFTQPLLYDQIRTRSTPREVFVRRLVAQGYMAEEEAAAIVQQSRDELDREMDERPEESPVASAAQRSVDAKAPVDDTDIFLRKGGAPVVKAGVKSTVQTTWDLKGLWQSHLGGSIEEEGDTSFDKARLQDLLVKASTVPDTFNAHPKIQRLLAQRLEMARGERPIDWSVGEQAAFATLVADKYRVRLSGQDCGRGTFSQRHAALADVVTSGELQTLQHLAPDQGRFDVIDSSLSEQGVLGFEYGYSLDWPDGLVLWEAQFGDFANGAQVLIDQFIAAGEQKWTRLSGLVLLLPHGYEGQGPEHSSAKLERFLQLCAEENFQVANCSTPANLFHLLRRQVLRRARKPLVVMTPKSLLRHPECVSTLDELANGSFQRLIDDASADPAKVRRVVLCSGRVYYDLVAERKKLAQEGVALVRCELLHPFPKAAIEAVLARYPSDAEVVWCQEEPKNMGAWPAWMAWWFDHLGPARFPRYVGRQPAAAPATGSHKKHAREQALLVSQALTF